MADFRTAHFAEFPNQPPTPEADQSHGGVIFSKYFLKLGKLGTSNGVLVSEPPPSPSRIYQRRRLVFIGIKTRKRKIRHTRSFRVKPIVCSWLATSAKFPRIGIFMTTKISGKCQDLSRGRVWPMLRYLFFFLVFMPYKYKPTALIILDAGGWLGHWRERITRAKLPNFKKNYLKNYPTMTLSAFRRGGWFWIRPKWAVRSRPFEYRAPPGLQPDPTPH